MCFCLLTRLAVDSCSIRSVFVTLTLNDGSVYRSLEGEEQAFIDDTILIVSIA